MPTLPLSYQSRRKRRHQSRQNWISRLGVSAAVLISLGSAVFVLSLILGYMRVTEGLASPAELNLMLNPESGFLLEPTAILDRTGSKTLFQFENTSLSERRFLSLELEDGRVSSEISNQAILAAVTAADPDFFNRPEIPWNQLYPRSQSSLHHQLVAELLLQPELGDTERWIRENFLAYQLSAGYSRIQVLEWHLNSLNYGNRLYGIEQASRFYFDKSADDLTLAEGAMLAAVSRTPALNPVSAPAAARENQLGLLEEMEEYQVITEQETRAARREQLVYNNWPENSGQDLPGYVDFILDEAASLVGQERLLRGGMRIISTLDADLQQQLVCATRIEILRVQGQDFESEIQGCETARLLPRYPGEILSEGEELSIQVATLDPQTGKILALHVENSAGEEDGILQLQPAGSLFTPVIYLNYFRQGFAPSSLLWDIPPKSEDDQIELSHPVCFPACDYQGPVNIRTAMVNEYLTPAVEIYEELGPYQIQNTLSQIGLPSNRELSQDCPYFPELPEINLLEAAQIYSVFANQGLLTGRAGEEGERQVQPISVERVEDVLGNQRSGPLPIVDRTVVSQALAYMVNDVLRDQNARSAAPVQDLFDIGRSAGVKTGFTADSGLHWLVGYLPQQVTAVRLVQDPETGLPPESALLVSTSVWRAITQYSANQIEVVDWEAPPDIVTRDVCSPSGMLPGEFCPDIDQDIFIMGNEPLQRDDLYQRVEINRETGLLASVFTPASQVEERIYLNIPPEAQTWANQQGLEIPPEAYDLAGGAETSADLEIKIPENFSSLRGLVEVRGSAGIAGLESYKLQFGRGLNPDQWFQIGEVSSRPIIDGVLAVWNTTDLDDGLYALQLVGVLEDQRIQKSSVVISLDNSPPEFELSGVENGQVLDYQAGEELLFAVQSPQEDEFRNVDFYLNNRLLENRDYPPYISPWQMAVGNFKLRAVVTDRAGNQTSRELEFSVVQR